MFANPQRPGYCWTDNRYPVRQFHRAPFPHKYHVLSRWGFLTPSGAFQKRRALDLIIIVKNFDKDRDYDICKALRVRHPALRLIEPADVIDIWDFFKAAPSVKDTIEVLLNHANTDEVDLIMPDHATDAQKQTLPKISIQNLCVKWKAGVNNLQKSLDQKKGFLEGIEGMEKLTPVGYGNGELMQTEDEFYFDLRCYNGKSYIHKNDPPIKPHQTSYLCDKDMDMDKLYHVPLPAKPINSDGYKLTRYNHGVYGLPPQPMPNGPAPPDWCQYSVVLGYAASYSGT